VTAGPVAHCTPSHCTWGDLGAMYSSAPLVGVAVVAAAVVLFLARRALPARIRWIGWAVIPLLIIVGVIGTRMHHG
jgi:hypothetical protein